MMQTLVVIGVLAAVFMVALIALAADGGDDEEG